MCNARRLIFYILVKSDRDFFIMSCVTGSEVFEGKR
jgi:hypothetical protein